MTKRNSQSCREGVTLRARRGIGEVLIVFSAYQQHINRIARNRPIRGFRGHRVFPGIHDKLPPMRKVLALALLLIGFMMGRLFGPVSVLAQPRVNSQPITLGVEALYLGMNEDSALAKFTSGYVVTTLGNQRMIARRSGKPDGSYDAIGAIGFSGNKLTSVAKFWVMDEQSLADFWDGIFGSVSGAVGTGRAQAEVYTHLTAEPGFSDQTVYLTLKGRTIELTKRQRSGEKSPSYNVEEMFR